MSNVKGYSLKHNIYVYFVFFLILDKEVYTNANMKQVGFTNYVVYIFINSALIGR